MFDWLFEGQLIVYVALAIVAAAPLFYWYTSDRRRRWLIAAGAGVALVGVYFLLDRLVETRREQITRKLMVEFPTGVRNKDAGRIFQHISDQFSYRGMDRAAFRKGVESRLGGRWVDDLTIWEVKFLDDQGKVSFMAKPKGGIAGDNVGFPVHADF